MSSTSQGRPRLTRKGAAKRARIVDAAAELIFQQGVARTTIEEVRDGAHVSSSQLYHYFDDQAGAGPRSQPIARPAVAAASFKRWEAGIMAGLLRMQALGRLGPEADPRKLALATLAALQGGLLLAQIQRDPEPFAAALDAMLTLIATLSSTPSTSLNR